jgi:truncated hemoglobin YjbI
MVASKSLTYYERLGSERISKIIQEFYDRAFVDPIIAHFFHRSDKKELVRLQTGFASSMLGGGEGYVGRSLTEAHRPFMIRNVHFNRRQVLMAEVLGDELRGEEENEIAKAWLKLEEKLRPKIVNELGGCQD